MNVCVTITSNFSLHGQVHYLGWSPEGDKVVVIMAQAGASGKIPHDLVSFQNIRLVAKHADCYFLAYFSLSSHERVKQL